MLHFTIRLAACARPAPNGLPRTFSALGIKIIFLIDDGWRRAAYAAAKNPLIVLADDNRLGAADGEVVTPTGFRLLSCQWHRHSTVLAGRLRTRGKCRLEAEKRLACSVSEGREIYLAGGDSVVADIADRHAPQSQRDRWHSCRLLALLTGGCGDGR